MDDSIRGMGDGGAERSLWALMELVRTVGNRILNTGSKSGPSNENERGVYFERRIFLIDYWLPLTHRRTQYSVCISSPSASACW